MHSLAKAIARHRELRRNQREINRALDRISSPSARDDIMLAVQRVGTSGR